MEWLPRADEVWIDLKTGRPTRRFFQFMHEVAELRLGGVQGLTVPQVKQDVDTTRSAVVGNITFTAQVSQYAQGVAATATASAQVAQDSGLAGAESIPPTPEPPVNPKFNDPE
jgi:hypothetical protein